MKQRTTAVVTGAASGLGAATVERLRTEGFRVVTVDRRDADYDLDVSDESAVIRAAREVGPVDVLVNSAGVVGSSSPFLETSNADWERLFAVNVLGTVNMMRAFVPGMCKGGWGRVVNIASMAGKDGQPTLSAYSASKGAVIALTKAAGKELAMTGVLVNAVAPALISTGMNEDSPDDVLQRIIDLIPMRRAGRPEEAAELIAFLCSERVTFSTGAVYDLSGGRATY